MHTLTMNATVGEDRVLNVELPNWIQPGEVELTVKYQAESDSTLPRLSVDEAFTLAHELRRKHGMSREAFQEWWEDYKREERR